MNTYVFYAGLLYTEYPFVSIFSPFFGVMNLPDGAYIRLPKEVNGSQWYHSDYTPVLLSDVPKELLALVLLLT